MDADFGLFDELYNSVVPVSDDSDHSSAGSSKDEDCPCSDIVEEHGMHICRSCGKEINKRKGMKKWAGIECGKGISDPGRCHIRKVDEKSIFKDVERYDFSSNIVHTANDLYIKVTNNKIYRGDSRKGIIFSCIFHAFKMMGNPQSFESLQTIFKLDRKVILKGMKYVSLYAPKNSSFRSTYITPVDIIDEIMTKLDAGKEHKNAVIELYNTVKSKSATMSEKNSMFNRSKPQSVAAGIVYYYIQKNNRNINMEDYIEMVKLSELTITKLVNEIDKILEEQ
jgi:transcription initiation factor TFIIIB Brf1 subunit/transcription initiation factor TFIIB